MANPNVVKNVSTTARRAIQAANAARHAAATANAAGDSENRSEYEVERLDGGEAWDPSRTGYAFSVRSPVEGGWGGWRDSRRPPWGEKTHLTLAASGGIRVRERRREMIAGQHYMRSVAGDQTVDVAGDATLHVRNDMQAVTHGVKASEHRPPEPGREKLTVMGDMTWRTDDRITLGREITFKRVWTGPIVRMIGMEGVMCGGPFMKTFSGISTTMAPLMSGDVYGNGNHAALSRIRMSPVLAYRSTEQANWQCAIYRRVCNHVIEPVDGSAAHKAAKEGWKQLKKWGVNSNPVTDIGFGLASMVISLTKMAYRKATGKKAEPDQNKGPKRTLTRTANGISQTRITDYILT